MRPLLAIADALTKLRDIPLLFFRFYLAYGFWITFMFKVEDLSKFAKNLADMHYPLPEVAAWVALITEGAGVLCLVFGFLTRLITLPLMFLLCVAIATVHWGHGYNACKGGWEIPLIFLMVLFSLLILGPGRISIDALFTRSRHKH